MLNHGTTVKRVDDLAPPASVDRTSLAVIIGTADNADSSAFPLNTPVLVAGNVNQLAKLDTVGDAAGTLPDACAAVFAQKKCALVIIRVASNADPDVQRSNVIGTTDASGDKSGFECMRDIKTLFGIKPSLVAAPGFTDDQATLTALLTMAERLKLMVYADCPGATYTDVVAYASNFGSRRLELLWPRQQNVHGRFVPLSAYRLGHEVMKDNIATEGYSGSASNLPMQGIVNAEHYVDFEDGEPTCMANLLNFNRVNTVINDDGFLFWGNLTNSTDTRWQFANRVRVFDKIDEASQRALRWARDKKIKSSTFGDDVKTVLDGMLQTEKDEGHLIGFTTWPNAELNTPENIALGKFRMDIKYTAPGIAQEITVGLSSVSEYN